MEVRGPQEPRDLFQLLLWAGIPRLAPLPSSPGPVVHTADSRLCILLS